jgi:hypothetical protein
MKRSWFIKRPFLAHQKSPIESREQVLESREQVLDSREQVLDTISDQETD